MWNYTKRLPRVNGESWQISRRIGSMIALHPWLERDTLRPTLTRTFRVHGVATNGVVYPLKGARLQVGLGVVRVAGMRCQ